MEDKIKDIRCKVLAILEEICDDEIILNSKIQVDLIKDGYIDSLGFILLINRLEDEFNIEIIPTQVKPYVWKNVDNITEYIIERVSIGKIIC